MTHRMWKILLVSLVGCPIVVIAIMLIQSAMISTGSLRGSSTFVRELLHEGPTFLVLLPAAVALVALANVGTRLGRHGRDGLPDRPRLVTWLILANFLVPVVAIVSSIAYWSFRY